MLDQSTRTSILQLHEAGHGSRAIARALGVSRVTVKAVLADGRAVPPPIMRAEKGEPYRQQILELYAACKGNLVRVHEELVEAGAALSYAALTAFCRRHELVRGPTPPTGEYHFEPGQEMQHDTSPHDLPLGGQQRRVQTASVVLCYSRMLFFQHYPRFDRFTCKLFLTDAAEYFNGVCQACMVDNTHVIVASGTGANMIPAPEMAAFAARLGFAFQAHEKGHADRSGRVERPFHFIENNFLAKRAFADFAAANREARIWCDKVNGTYKKHLRAVPRELFAVERPALQPRPLWVPEVYALHHRLVDSEGYVHVNTNRYTAPWKLIGHRLEVRETRDRIDLYDGPRQVASHARVLDPVGARVQDPAHRPPRGEGRSARGDVSPEETQLRRLVPELANYLDRLKRHAPTRALRHVRQLLRLVGDYPREPLLTAVATAEQYGLFDLDRVERLVLRALDRDYFFVPPTEPPAAGSPTAPPATLEESP
jgi:transposase